MESRRLTRRVQHLGAGPTKEVRKATPKKGSRKPLADKTNDSPVSGLTPETSKPQKLSKMEKTPSSKLRRGAKSSPTTPGEEVLRTQVHSLLNKVEKRDTEVPNLQAMLSSYCPSPGGMEAPTPANTPADVPLTEQRDIRYSSQIRIPLTPFEEQLSSDHELQVEGTDTSEIGVLSSEVANCSVNRQCDDETQGEVLPLDLQLLYLFGRSVTAPTSDDKQKNDPDALNLDTLRHLEKVMYNSVQTEATNLALPVPTDSVQVELSTFSKLSAEWVGRDIDSDDSEVDDGASDCSVLVNVSSPNATHSLKPTPEKSRLINSSECGVPAQWQQRSTPQDEEHEDYEDNDDYEDFGEENAENEHEEQFDQECDELCQGLSSISMNEDGAVGIPAFTGRHVRFNYNSDDEMEEEIVADKKAATPSDPAVMILKGLPTPKGKHLRFNEL